MRKRKYADPKSGYDEACEALAEHFLRDEPALMDRKGELAGAIQQAVEDWFRFEERDRAQTNSCAIPESRKKEAQSRNN